MSAIFALVGVDVCAIGFFSGTGSFEESRQIPADTSQQPNIDGVVEVSFKIDNQGKAEILNINATSPKLADYVLKKLAKIQLEKSNDKSGKVIKYRFVFKKQA